MKLMCLSAVRGIQIRCYHGHGVTNEDEDAGATELLKSTPLELKYLDPNNLDC